MSMDFLRHLDTILLGDCMEVLRTLPDKSFDLLLTDPPYGGNICRIGGSWASKYSKKIKDWDKTPTQEVFNELFRVSKQQIIWGGNYFELPATRCFNVWRKVSISEKFTMAMCEYAWTSFNKNAKFWEIAPQDAERFHPTQKPVELFARQLEEYSKPGDLILDPFSGSGTTAIAAHRLGRRFLCIEKDADYHAASVKRLAKEKEQLLLKI